MSKQINSERAQLKTLTLDISSTGWTLTARSPYPCLPDKVIYEGRWSSGPIEIARILKRLGHPLIIRVEPNEGGIL
jgi:hypothetical protein